MAAGISEQGDGGAGRRVRPAAGARAPKTANATTGSGEVRSSATGRMSKDPAARRGPAPRHRGRPQVERESATMPTRTRTVARREGSRPRPRRSGRVGGFRQDAPCDTSPTRSAVTAWAAGTRWPRSPGHRPGRGHPGDDRPARDGGPVGLPPVGPVDEPRSPTSTGALRRPQPGRSSRDAPHAVRLPAATCCRRRGERLRSGRRPPGPAGLGTSSRAGLAEDGLRSMSPERRPYGGSPICAPSCPAQQLREQAPEPNGPPEMSPGKSYGATVPIAPWCSRSWA